MHVLTMTDAKTPLRGLQRCVVRYGGKSATDRALSVVFVPTTHNLQMHTSSEREVETGVQLLPGLGENVGAE